MADSTDEAMRSDLVGRAQLVLKRTALPAGYNAVVVVTDPAGNWCGVASTSDDSYTRDLLLAALEGAEYRAHARLATLTTEAEECPSTP